MVSSLTLTRESALWPMGSEIEPRALTPTLAALELFFSAYSLTWALANSVLPVLSGRQTTFTSRKVFCTSSLLEALRPLTASPLALSMR